MTARRLLNAALASLLGVAVAACGSPAPTATPRPTSTPTTNPTPGGGSPAPTVDTAAIYAAIEGQVRSVRGLDPTSDVDPQVIDGDTLGEMVEESFHEDNPAELVEANERLLKGMGLIPPDASLEDLYISLLSSQVAGFYSPDDKELYVVSRTGALGPTEKTTFAHEYTHALQDQNFDLAGLGLDDVGQGDRAVARLALVEGDATLTMTYWQIENLSQLEILRLLGESFNPEITGPLEDMPPVLRESLLFPYTGGLTFTQTLQMTNGWEAIDAAFDAPPESTEQVLHPEKYPTEKPLTVDLPNDLAARMGAGWSVGLEDTLGEFQLRLWLAEAGAREPEGADAAAAGWGGDRTVILYGPAETYAIAIATAWDSPADAAEFAEKARAVADDLPDAADVVGPIGDGTTVTVVIGSTNDIVGRLENVLGLAS